MRILIIFTDMVRANRLTLINNSTDNTPLDNFISQLGGTLFTNCFSEAPDTPRALATLYTGYTSTQNGCDSRLKWPKFFLSDDCENFFSYALNNSYAISCFSNPNERNVGLFPKEISDLPIHNEDLDLKKFLSSIKIQDNHLIFISLPDFHWALDDYGYSTSGEHTGYQILNSSLEIIIKAFDKNDFDHIFLFSDHGFKFEYELRSEDKLLLLNEDRTNVLLVHRQKNQKNLEFDHSLLALSDVYQSIIGALSFQSKSSNEAITLTKSNKELIYIEDHLNFAPSINQPIEIWAVVKNEIIYIRTLKKACCIDRQTREINYEISNKFDSFLQINTSFGRHYDEYEKLSLYQGLTHPQKTYMNGKLRVRKNSIFKLINTIKDFILNKVLAP